MMQSYEGGLVVEVLSQEGELSLRLDRHGDSCPQEAFAHKPIVILTLREISPGSELENELQEAVGTMLEYDVVEQPSGTYRVHFETDRWIEIDCTAVTEEEADYSWDDLMFKCRKLSALYFDAAQKTHRLERECRAFYTELLVDIRKERDRCERKREAHSIQAESLQAQIRAYDRVLTILAFLHEKYPKATS